jgi:predicted DNA binding CopG/RHH family protein
MKYYELTKEEKELLKQVEVGEWIFVKDQKKALREARAIAKNTLNKTRNINIRLTERVLTRLKARAVEEGIPYQTLASSVLHKFVSR